METNSLAGTFRALRNAWFSEVLHSYSPEREWEDEEREQLRKKQNAELRRKFDDDTERLIAGEDRPVHPRCAHDMTRPT